MKDSQSGYGGAGPDKKTRDEIDQNLRSVYRQTLDEDLPPQMQALLAQLRDRQG
ncbi:MAG: NepR family anti-sigma factor [Pseudomonadota bacterium]